jgi:hypothetical protein
MTDADDGLTADRTGTRHDNAPVAQRLWLLERIADDACTPYRDVCRFTGAIAILSRGAIYILFVRAREPHATTAARLDRPGLRFDLERDAVRFANLDNALEWTDQRKRTWMSQGWTEVIVDAAERFVERSDAIRR